MKSRSYLLYGSPAVIAILGLVLVIVFLNTEYTRAAVTVRYVAPDGMCGGATPCYATLQLAVDAAEAGDDIRIAEGVYTDVNHYAGLAQLVYLSKTVTLRGGYSTADWENSMPISHPTILDAQSAGRGLYIIGYISPTIENLSMRGGDAMELGGTPRFPLDSAGGGLYAISATITLRNTVWSQNRAGVGSAIYSENSHFSLLGSTILSNTGALLGGGMFLEKSDSRLVDNVFEGNGAGYGGGLAVYDGSAELNSNRIVSNQSSYHGGGVLFESADGSLIGNIITGNIAGGPGGGASLSGDILISQNTISQNTGDWGGGIALWEGNISLIGNTITDNSSGFLGGGVASTTSGSLDPNRKIVADNIISRNASPMGGGLFLSFVRPVLMRNLIEDNISQGDGGGIYANDCQVNMDGDIVTGNTAQGNGGGLALIQYGQSSLSNVILADNQADGDGSGLYTDRNSVDIAQATIANNIGRTGIYVQSGLPLGLGSSRVTMTNTIVASHTLAINATANSTVTIHGVLWFGNGTMISGAGTYLITNMIDGDPGFTSGGYHLSASSAAIDSGIASNISHDIDLEPRPYRQFDLGADEFWPAGVLKQVYLPIVSH